MDVRIESRENTLRFIVTGKIDERGAEDLKSRFQEHYRPGIQTVVFDFSQVGHIGSAGIGKLLLFYKELAVTGGNLVIENADETVFELFKTLRLNTIFSVRKAETKS